MSAPSPQATPTTRSGRGLRALVAATGVSSLGDGAFVAAAPLAAAAITRDPAAVATVTAAEYLPWLLVAPFAGYYVDRWPRRPTMIISDLLRAAALGGLALLIAIDAGSVAVIAACAFLVVAGTVFHSAAAEATIAELAVHDTALLHTVNGRQQAAYTAGRQLVGPPVGSLLFSVARWLPFGFDALTFVGSALLVSLVPHTTTPRPETTGIWRALRESTAYLLAHRTLRTLALLTAAGNFSISMVLGVLVLYATDAHGLNVSDAGYGVLLVAMAVGGIGGGMLAPRVMRRFVGRRAILVGIATQGVAWLLLAATGHAIVAGAALALAFMAVAVVSVVVVTARQQQVPPQLLGRVISAFRIIGNGPAPVGALVGGMLASVAGLRAPIVLAAIIALATVLLAGRVRLEQDQ
jgi:MFS family permease